MRTVRRCFPVLWMGAKAYALTEAIAPRLGDQMVPAFDVSDVVPARCEEVGLDLAATDGERAWLGMVVVDGVSLDADHEGAEVESCEAWIHIGTTDRLT